MVNAAEALRDQTYNRGLIVQCLAQPPHCMDFFDFKPRINSAMKQFLDECEHRHSDWLEVSIAKAAHHSFYMIAMDLAKRRIAGEDIDLEMQRTSDSDLGRAHDSLVAAIWRLERRLHSMAA